MKYRKKPVMVEAFQMTSERRENSVDWPEWLHQAWNLELGEPGSLSTVELENGDVAISIGTLEGIFIVSDNDWIIKGVVGELYPCKPDIFEATYEKVE